MTNPIETITEMMNKYLWPVEPQPTIKPELKETNDKIEKVNPLRKRASSKVPEPSWSNVVVKGRCAE